MDIETIRFGVLFSELIAAIVGTFYFYKYKKSSLRPFLYLLWFITFIEFSVWYVSTNKVEAFLFFDENNQQYNLWFYNLLRIVTFLTLYYIYYKYIGIKRFKNIIRIFAVFYVISLIINWSFVQNFFFEMSEIPKVLGAIFLIITIIFYFIELLRSDKIVISHKLLSFWISVGLILYYTGTIPFALKFNGYMLFPGVHKLFLINTILAILMYLIFAFGFIWSKKEEN